MIDDEELDKRLLSHIVDRQRKAMRVIATVFADIGYECSSALLWGEGDERRDDLLERSIARLKALTHGGAIDAVGDLSQPGFSEVWIRRTEASQDLEAPGQAEA